MLQLFNYVHTSLMKVIFKRILGKLFILGFFCVWRPWFCL
uniref:Uncharacterized protein n=1 Tax=Arundo donax TaxID=35708 RepID=A0A0A9H795_ARUDO